MDIPRDRYYTESHEWVRVEGEKAFIGITDHAQHELGDLVFVEQPEIGKNCSAGDEALTIESVKAAAPIYAPFAGEITGFNDQLEKKPELINEKPYDTFIFSMVIREKSALSSLMDADAYTGFISAET